MPLNQSPKRLQSQTDSPFHKITLLPFILIKGTNPNLNSEAILVVCVIFFILVDAHILINFEINMRKLSHRIDPL